MHKLILFAFFSVAIASFANQPLTFSRVDSLTLQYYLTGRWDSLLVTGQEALSGKLDYKLLRQRMGYAYFVKGNYLAAKMQYEKAYSFDKSDEISMLYLYFCGQNTGNEVYARFYAEKLSVLTRKYWKIQTFRPIDAMDLEYNYKTNSSKIRSNPTYKRIGLNSQLGYRLSLYQSLSTYQQKTDSITLVRQPEYYVRLKGAITASTSMDVAYHRLNTDISGYSFPGDMLFSELSSHFYCFNYGLNASVMRNDLGDFKQIGIFSGAVLPGKAGVYCRSYLCRMIETNKNRMIFSQLAGMRLRTNLWAEGNVTLGNLRNYQDNGSLYIYNGLDPTTFRTGISLYWILLSKITLTGNYMYDKKQIESNKDQYNQQSFTAGIRWKL